MKVSSIALGVLLAAPYSCAFVPSSSSLTSPLRSTPFGVVSSSSRSGMNQRRRDFNVLSSTSMDAMAVELAEIVKKTKSSSTPEQDLSSSRSSVTSYLSQYVGESGAGVVYRKLQEQGVQVVNGYSGGAVLPLLDQFHEDHPRHSTSGEKPIRWITNSNESSSGHIAEGIAKSSENVGVVVATSGPGVTNLVTPLQDAICDGVPILVLCGQAATTAPQDAFQFAPAVQITTPCTKWSYQIQSATEIALVMDYAFYLATSGRPGPVFIDLPKDLQNQLVTEDSIQEFVQSIPLQDHEFDDVQEWQSFLNCKHNFARFIPYANGENSMALHMGKPDQGLSFQISPQNEIKAVEQHTNHNSPNNQLYHKDHHPTNKVYEYESGLSSPLEGENNKFTKMMLLIQKAKRPIIIAGNGCNGCPSQLAKFATALQIPVTSTLHAMGSFDERHPLALNMFGMHGHPTPNFMVQEADLIIAIGSRFDDRITGKVSAFAPNAHEAASRCAGGIIHVDLRLSEQAKQVKPTYFCHTRGETFLKACNSFFEKDKIIEGNTKEWLNHMSKLKREFPIKIPSFASSVVEDEICTPMSAQSVISKLNSILLSSNLAENTIFSTGVGIHQMVAAQLLTWTQPRQMLSSGSLGTMGVALGYIIGAKLANAGKICIAIDGDGSFNMTFTELKTVAEQKIPIKIMILDNEGQMMVEYWQRLFHDERYLAVRNTNTNPDYVKLAEAFGIKHLYCDREEDLESTLNKFIHENPEEPVVLHCRIKRTPCLPLVAPGESLENMILEDCEGSVDCDASAAPS